MSEGDYPLGAKYDKNAPYNQEPPKEKEVEVCISVTMHKTVKLTVPEDYDNIVLRVAAVENTWKELSDMHSIGWNEDEFEVIEE